ncbi:hypothetical protein A2454_06355 [Candidatus Peribacteria bacterium RIFOXYC2_FULL_55_14]|nr:MAG: hypothetical protein UY85_C0001G0042 [Candidatus Peribacteria bacterium GW2011_GWB1_54_5]KKW40502.1 MAG: hypothetical protein UY87_C0020G0014 [Candidatus Peribacteria bacterium GW2011_GWC2_54_8]OGJ71875.1 MAG: hypothetical protein A2198_03220 [Candidatus Peribacteria bacterium RIFOXYA1_FULL_56_14]OGJ72781.1 MAG: hypothetical protein A2217_04850 [Candidatus Peribacteria bacterium RIFOXYA2_FULL_55_28]OGJ75316.1 MAG: hypothetical protein A2384_00215 [Candidatus Peribacteria bacterium RIFOX
MRNVLRHIRLIPRKSIMYLIGLYQATLSPDHGQLKSMYPYGFCRHQPTCSEYGKQVIADRGMIGGMPLLIKRLLSCHPWTTPSEKRILAILKRNAQ